MPKKENYCLYCQVFHQMKISHSATHVWFSFLEKAALLGVIEYVAELQNNLFLRIIVILSLILYSYYLFTAANYYFWAVSPRIKHYILLHKFDKYPWIYQIIFNLIIGILYVGLIYSFELVVIALRK